MRQMAIRLAILLVVLGYAVPAATGRAQQSPTDLDTDMTFFYKQPSPERIAQILTNFNKSTLVDQPFAHPPLAGLLAAAFGKYPTDIDKMIPASLMPRVQTTVAMALRLAGQNERAKALVERMKTSGFDTLDLNRIPPSLDAISVMGPTEFDIMWGASFATGDPRYCSRIMERFAAVANVDGNAEDMVAIVKGMIRKTDMHWIVNKRGTEKARELINVSSALWALDSNARQHDFVRTFVDGYIKLHSQEPATKALLALK